MVYFVGIMMGMGMIAMIIGYLTINLESRREDEAYFDPAVIAWVRMLLFVMCWGMLLIIAQMGSILAAESGVTNLIKLSGTVYSIMALIFWVLFGLLMISFVNKALTFLNTREW